MEAGKMLLCKVESVVKLITKFVMTFPFRVEDFM